MVTKPVLRPFTVLTPEAAAEVLKALSYALDVFAEWGIVPKRGSWVDEVRHALEHVVETCSLGSSEDDLRRTSAAIALAVDLYHVGISLGSDPNPVVAAELRRVLGGKLLGRGGNSAGADFLSQFWFGTLLAQSKLKTHLLGFDTPNKSKPDFVVEKNGSRFAVEFKRPRTEASAGRALLTAGGQLRQYECPGIVVLDVTEVLLKDPWAVSQTGPSVSDRVRDTIGPLHQQLVEVVTSYRRSNKFTQTAMLLTFARYWGWKGENGLIRDAGIQFQSYGFPYIWSRQITQLTWDIQDSMRVGIRQLTGNEPSFHYS